MSTQAYLEQMAEHLKSWSQRVDDLKSELTQPQASEGRRQAYIDQMAEYLDGWSQRMKDIQGKLTSDDAGSDSPGVRHFQKVVEKQEEVASALRGMREAGDGEFGERRNSLENAIGGLNDAFREALVYYK
jgi:chromosome segregation ATPase